VEHWAKTLKIKGLGPATIEKLNLQSIEEIYQMDLALMVELLDSSKIAIKLYKEIMYSTESSLEDLLPAFGIPLIGDTASKKICKVISCIEDINELTCAEAGLGPKATENLLQWWNTFSGSYLNFPFNYQVTKSVVSATKGIVCISGKLNSFKNKTEAKEALEKAGYLVKDTLTKDVTILVNEGGVESAKTKKARETGIKIIENLKEII
jgi:NAD-dependent DNA ligase